MEPATTSSTKASAGWAAGIALHARAHWPSALALGLACIAMLAMLLASLSRLASGAGDAALALAFIAGMACFAANALGAAPALLLRSIPKRVEHVLLGFAAGMMLAASF